MPELMPFQVEGVKFLRSKQRVILADDMGLGKTAQALSSLNGEGCRVICPASVQDTWIREAAKWTNYSAKKSRELDPVPKGEIWVCSYGVADAKMQCTTLILDEAHAVKSTKTKRHKACRSIAGRAHRVIGLTGTPILKDPMDIYGLTQCIGIFRLVYQNWSNFLQLSGAYELPFGGYAFSSDLTPLKKPLWPYYMSRLKSEEVDMPSLTREDLRVCLDSEDSAAFEEISRLYPEDSKAWDNPSNIAELSQALERLSLCKAVAMLEEMPELIEPVVYFSAHVAAAKYISTKLVIPLICGETKTEDRQAIVDKLQSGDVKGIAATIGAAGVGLTMTKACTAVFVSKTYSYALNLQARDRVYRIGQDRPVRIYDVVSESPLDKAINKAERRKQRYHEQIHKHAV